MSCAEYALVLGCDLSSDGKRLGPRTIARLEEAYSSLETGCKNIVITAGISPYHHGKKETMAEMMYNWLFLRGCPGEDVIVLRAKTFNTRAELEAFFEFLRGLDNPAVSISIFSSSQHLRRTRLLVAQMYGLDVANSIEYHPVKGESINFRNRFILEPLKLVYLYLPAGWRKKLKPSLVKVFHNPSY